MTTTVDHHSAYDGDALVRHLGPRGAEALALEQDEPRLRLFEDVRATLVEAVRELMTHGRVQGAYFESA